MILSGFGTIITLPDPEFDDTLEIEHLRLNTQSRGGTRIMFRDPDWPITETLGMKFTDLSQNVVWALLKFIQLTLGKTISLIDQYDTEWSGIITNPDAQAEQSSRAINADCGGFSIELKFEGVQV